MDPLPEEQKGAAGRGASSSSAASSSLDASRMSTTTDQCWGMPTKTYYPIFPEKHAPMNLDDIPMSFEEHVKDVLMFQVPMTALAPGATNMMQWASGDFAKSVKSLYQLFIRHVVSSNPYGTFVTKIKNRLTGMIEDVHLPNAIFFMEVLTEHGMDQNYSMLNKTKKRKRAPAPAPVARRSDQKEEVKDMVVEEARAMDVSDVDGEAKMEENAMNILKAEVREEFMQRSGAHSSLGMRNITMLRFWLFNNNPDWNPDVQMKEMAEENGRLLQSLITRASSRRTSASRKAMAAIAGAAESADHDEEENAEIAVAENLIPFDRRFTNPLALLQHLSLYYVMDFMSMVLPDAPLSDPSHPLNASHIFSPIQGFAKVTKLQTSGTLSLDPAVCNYLNYCKERKEPQAGEMKAAIPARSAHVLGKYIWDKPLDASRCFRLPRAALHDNNMLAMAIPNRYPTLPATSLPTELQADDSEIGKLALAENPSFAGIGDVQAIRRMMMQMPLIRESKGQDSIDHLTTEIRELKLAIQEIYTQLLMDKVPEEDARRCRHALLQYMRRTMVVKVANLVVNVKGNTSSGMKALALAKNNYLAKHKGVLYRYFPKSTTNRTLLEDFIIQFVNSLETISNVSHQHANILRMFIASINVFDIRGLKIHIYQLGEPGQGKSFGLHLIVRITVPGIAQTRSRSTKNAQSIQKNDDHRLIIQHEANVNENAKSAGKPGSGPHESEAIRKEMLSEGRILTTAMTMDEYGNRRLKELDHKVNWVVITNTNMNASQISTAIGDRVFMSNVVVRKRPGKSVMGLQLQSAPPEKMHIASHITDMLQYIHMMCGLVFICVEVGLFEITTECTATYLPRVLDRAYKMGESECGSNRNRACERVRANARVLTAVKAVLNVFCSTTSPFVDDEVPLSDSKVPIGPPFREEDLLEVAAHLYDDPNIFVISFGMFEQEFYNEQERRVILAMDSEYLNAAKMNLDKPKQKKRKRRGAEEEAEEEEEMVAPLDEAEASSILSSVQQGGLSFLPSESSSSSSSSSVAAPLVPLGSLLPEAQVTLSTTLNDITLPEVRRLEQLFDIPLKEVWEKARKDPKLNQLEDLVVDEQRIMEEHPVFAELAKLPGDYPILVTKCLRDKMLWARGTRPPLEPMQDRIPEPDVVTGTKREWEQYHNLLQTCETHEDFCRKRHLLRQYLRIRPFMTDYKKDKMYHFASMTVSIDTKTGARWTDHTRIKRLSDIVQTYETHAFAERPRNEDVMDCIYAMIRKSITIKFLPADAVPSQLSAATGVLPQSTAALSTSSDVDITSFPSKERPVPKIRIDGEIIIMPACLFIQAVPVYNLPIVREALRTEMQTAYEEDGSRLIHPVPDVATPHRLGKMNFRRKPVTLIAKSADMHSPFSKDLLGLMMPDRIEMVDRSFTHTDELEIDMPVEEMCFRKHAANLGLVDEYFTFRRVLTSREMIKDLRAWCEVHRGDRDVRASSTVLPYPEAAFGSAELRKFLMLKFHGSDDRVQKQFKKEQDALMGLDLKHGSRSGQPLPSSSSRPMKMSEHMQRQGMLMSMLDYTKTSTAPKPSSALRNRYNRGVTARAGEATAPRGRVAQDEKDSKEQPVFESQSWERQIAPQSMLFRDEVQHVHSVGGGEDEENDEEDSMSPSKHLVHTGFSRVMVEPKEMADEEEEDMFLPLTERPHDY